MMTRDDIVVEKDWESSPCTLVRAEILEVLRH